MSDTALVQDRARIAIAIGDPAGIGPEIAIKAAHDPRLRAVAEPLLVGDPAAIAFHAEAAGLSMPADIYPVEAGLGMITPGIATAEGGRAALAFVAAAVALARDGGAGAVVAAPHTQSAIAKAGIAFDGYPGFVAGLCDMDPDEVFLMLVNDRMRIAHVTLHLGLRAALDSITAARIEAALAAMERALGALGIARPRIGVAGINPHAGEGGLMGREEIEVVIPALEAARERGIAIEGPHGADTLLLRGDCDAFLVMYHDQGHVPAKLIGFDDTSAMPLGLPVRFASVGHGSAYDIAGKGTADASALIKTALRLCGAA